jgi:hypothetical protein
MQIDENLNLSLIALRHNAVQFLGSVRQKHQLPGAKISMYVNRPDDIGPLSLVKHYVNLEDHNSLRF